MPTFDLIAQPWLPCRLLDGSQARLGLAETLARAGTIRDLVHPSPLVTAALHRLLLAVLHRTVGPATSAAWSAIWTSGQWDDATLTAYWTRWRDRFDLFHPSHPFYQVAALEPGYAAPVSRLVHEMTSGNNPTLFDHTTDSLVPALSAGEAAAYLVASQAFALGGRITFAKGEKEHGSADAAPLSRGAVCLVKGENLFQTLLLNLVRYNRADEVPWRFSAGDRPAWEADDPIAPRDREVLGPIDLLTWQSRRVRLLPEEGPDGEPEVRAAVVMKGEQFPDRARLPLQETMLAFKKSLRASGDDQPWIVVGFAEERALWRDSLALVQAVGGQRARPKTLSWLDELVSDGVLPPDSTLPLDFYGLSGDQAKVLLWRHERLALPVAYLRDAALVEQLGIALAWAEGAATLLTGGPPTPNPSGDPIPRPASLLGALLTRPNSGRAARDVLDQLALTRAYWPALDLPFRALLTDLPGDALPAQAAWGRLVYRAALRAFDAATGALAPSPRVLRAVVIARSALRRQLNVLLRDVFDGSSSAKEEAA